MQNSDYQAASGSLASNNPYASGDLAIDGHNRELETRLGNDNTVFPAAITVIGIVLLIFGIVGVPTGLWNIASPFVLPMLPQFDDESQRSMMSQMADLKGFLLVSGSYCTILSISMFIAGVGLLKKRLWGAKLGATVCLAAIVYKLIELGGAIYSQQAFAEQMSATMSRSNSDAMETETISRIMSFVMVGVAILFSIPFYIFYGWAAYYLRRDQTRSHLG